MSGDRGVAPPPVVAEAARRYGAARSVWRNELGGLTFALGDTAHLTWNPRSTGVDLGRERDALGWLAGRHPVPGVLDSGCEAGPDGARGHVDLGDLTVGDRWADLAVASLSLDWDFGEGHQAEFSAAYGIAPDPERISWYRSLGELES